MAPGADCCEFICCGPCQTCQNARELKCRGHYGGPASRMGPPPVQQMHTASSITGATIIRDDPYYSSQTQTVARATNMTADSNPTVIAPPPYQPPPPQMLSSRYPDIKPGKGQAPRQPRGSPLATQPYDPYTVNQPGAQMVSGSFNNTAVTIRPSGFGGEPGSRSFAQSPVPYMYGKPISNSAIGAASAPVARGTPSAVSTPGGEASDHRQSAQTRNRTLVEGVGEPYDSL